MHSDGNVESEKDILEEEDDVSSPLAIATLSMLSETTAVSSQISIDCKHVGEHEGATKQV